MSQYPDANKPLTTIEVASLNAGPPQQTMGDYRMLGSTPGLLVRQKLRMKNCIPCLMKNKFQVGEFPQGLDPNEPWEDEVFATQSGTMFVEEESECMDKCLCGNYRAFTLRAYTGGEFNRGNEIMRMDRPFKCPIICCCFNPWPQELTVSNPATNLPLGTVKQDWRCVPALCGKTYWKLQRPDGEVHHVIERDICCNSNCFAPSCLCKIHKIDIKSADETRVVGSLENIFPGCTCRTILCGGLIDNYRLTFPTDSTPEEKANIFGALYLIDYMVFSNNQQQNEGMAAAMQ